MVEFAYILSAGWGTRLRPLTFFRPKVLMPVGRKTLLELWLSKLAGLSKVFVNIHALSPVSHEYLHLISLKYPFLSTIYEHKILGSGGSLFSISSSHPHSWILSINGDSFLSNDLGEILRKIDLGEPSIYLVLKNEPGFNNVVVTPDGLVKEIRRCHLTEAEISSGCRLLAYIGIQLFHSSLLYYYGSIFAGSLMSDSVPIPYMDVMEIYKLMIKNGVPIRCIEITDGTWFDIGIPDRYLDLCKTFPESPLLGVNVTIEPGAVVKSSVLWDGVLIKTGSRLEYCIVIDGAVVSGNHQREIIGPGRIWKF